MNAFPSPSGLTAIQTGYAEAVIPPQGQPAPRSNLDVQLDELSARVGQQRDLIERLASRLNPIIRPVPATPSGGKTGAQANPCMSQVGERLFDVTNTLDCHNQAIAGLLELV